MQSVHTQWPSQKHVTFCATKQLELADIAWGRRLHPVVTFFTAGSYYRWPGALIELNDGKSWQAAMKQKPSEEEENSESTCTVTASVKDVRGCLEQRSSLWRQVDLHVAVWASLLLCSDWRKMETFCWFVLGDTNKLQLPKKASIFIV